MYDLSTISLMSAPAANALSEPVMRMQLTPASASKASTAPRSSPISWTLSAFKACGRLRRTMPTRPRRSTMMVSLLIAVLGSRLDRPCCHGASRAESPGHCGPRGLPITRSVSQALSGLALTDWAEERRSAGLRHPPDCAIAARRRTGFPGAIIDAEIVLEITELTIGAAGVAQRRAAGRDRLREHGLDGIDQLLRALVRCTGLARDGRRAPLGREPCAVKRLADIDIPEPGDDPLVRQRRLERGLLAFARARKHRRVEFVAQRLGTERAQQRLAVEFGARNELHHAEAARIVEGDAHARRHVEHDVIVSGVLRAVVVVATRGRLAAPPRHAKRTRHSEMHHQHLVGGKIGEEILGAPAEPLDCFAFEPGHEILGQRPAQIAAVGDDFVKARALHHRPKAAAHSLDFGQFGHCPTHSVMHAAALWSCRQ